MLAKIDSACLVGMDAAPVRVDVSLANGLPAFSIVGLPDAAVREARDRVVSAIRNTGFEFPTRKVTVNLAPADLRKEGACFDLAIAVGILMASEALTPTRWPRAIWVGELALDGSIRPVRTALPLARSLRAQGVPAMVIPEGNWPQVAFVEGLDAYPFHDLRSVVEWLHGRDLHPRRGDPGLWRPASSCAGVDLAEIKGQTQAKRALEIAAAGGHHALFLGPPGTGKSMLAQALPGLLPPWSLDEALETTQVYAVHGDACGDTLLPRRPFRSPHHTASPAALIGGGDTPRPGELSLAHHGVLFLDELPEFRRDTLEALRQPIEEGRVHLQRVRGRAVYPARMLLVAAMNPCPCGYRGHPRRDCTCSDRQLERYRSKISGPLLDRMDLHVEVPSLKTDELFGGIGSAPESSATVRARVAEARERQRARYRHAPAGFTNARLGGADLARHCPVSNAGRDLLTAAVERLGLSARALDRVRRVARTIADLSGSVSVENAHLAEAIQLRALDRPLRGHP